MVFALNKKDSDLLKIIAEHRILTVEQMAWLSQKSKDVVYRRIRCLEKEGLIHTTQKYLGQNIGRPKTLVDLTNRGIDLLKNNGVIDRNIPYENINARNINCLGHQMLMNWLRIHFNYAEKTLPTIRVRFLSHNSPFLQRDPLGRISLSDTTPVMDSEAGEVIKFEPDGVLSITDSSQDLTILLFLEVDCSTETLASPRRDMTDIRQKIVNYQTYFLSERYKRYEEFWKCKLQGFHLLFLTNSIGRLASLCRLAQEMGPEDTCFVYFTEQSRLFEQGVTGTIWARAGDLTVKQESIFGHLGCSTPLTTKNQK